MRVNVALLSVLALGAAAFTSSAARAAIVGAPLPASVDIAVPPTGDSPVAFATYPNARCVLSVAGMPKTITVYANDGGSVSFHVTPSRGATSAVMTARCDARGRAATRYIRFVADRRAPRPLVLRRALEARPLVPFGSNPATLSQADTKRLELPPRPDASRDPQGYAEWLRAVTTPVTRIRGNTILRRDIIHGPMKSAGYARTALVGKKNGSATSNNWSGIVDVGGSLQFTNWVAGKWTVPSVITEIADSPAYSSIWDGIDGSGSGDVIQNGTEQDAYDFGLFGRFSFYSAWYEFFPDGGSTTLPNFSVNPGDDIYAASWLCYDGNGQRYGCYYMENYTQGEATPVYFELGSRPDLFLGNSAEWIAERPTVNGGLSPMPYFGAFPFSWEHVYDSYSGAGANACNETENVVSMFNGANELASAFTTGCDSSESYWTGFQ